ncbi:hypothetical protein [Desulfobacter curvatus]|uniref:hypothetical protein n=1 Tax=Desulfobacter curvatus TaxID=2290 RepID=UPI000365E411|nr:hypothetical protein [Desulfobacter curvatus]
MMKTCIQGVYYRIILIFFCLACFCEATAADIDWEAAPCSCAPNADIPVIGYYDASLPGEPENESADDQEDKKAFLNFSLLTRLTYVCNTLNPDGTLVPYWDVNRIKNRIVLAQKFNTRVDLGLKLSPQFESFKIPDENDLETLAGGISDQILAFKNDLKTELYRERVKYVSKIIAGEFSGELGAIKDEINQMNAAFIETDQVKANFDLLNQKLNETIGLVLKVRELDEIVKTEKTKEQLKEEIFEKLKLKKKEERSLFGKIVDYILFFIPENYETLEEQSSLEADQETIEKKGQIIHGLIKEYLADYEKLVSLPHWKDISQEPEPEKKVSEDRISSPDVLTDSLAVLEAGLRDCSSEFCIEKLAKLKSQVRSSMAGADIPDDVFKTVMEQIKISTPEETVTAPETILEEIKKALKTHKAFMDVTPKDWVWKPDSKFEITSLARDLWGFVRKMGFGGLTLDLSELKSQESKGFFDALLSAVKETKPDNEVHINLIISSRIFDADSTPGKGDGPAVTLRTYAAFLDTIIVKFPGECLLDSTTLQLAISRYINWAGATDKLLLYLNKDDLGLLNPMDSAKKAQLEPDEAGMRLLKKDTQGLCLDQDVFISNDASNPPDPFLSEYIIDTEEMFFVRELLYEFNKNYLNLCVILCPFKNPALAFIRVLAVIWLFIWLLSVSFNWFDSLCGLKAFLSEHFIVFWGTGLLVFLSWFLIVLCDPFMKEHRQEAFYIIAGVIVVKILMGIWRRLLMAKR